MRLDHAVLFFIVLFPRRTRANLLKSSGERERERERVEREREGERESKVIRSGHTGDIFGKKMAEDRAIF